MIRSLRRIRPALLGITFVGALGLWASPGEADAPPANGSYCNTDDPQSSSQCYFRCVRDGYTTGYCEVMLQACVCSLVPDIE
ncbi:MAG: hypothetical protein ABW277_19740 [Longimicrobiaceae bacterium]